MVTADSSTRDRILEGADALFGEVGFEATTTRQIAERSGVNKALIHYHFKNKDALLESVLDRYYDALAATVTDALGVSGAGDVRTRLLGLIDAYVGFLAENRGFSRIIQREAAGGRQLERIRQRTLPLFQMGVAWMQGAFPKTETGDLAAAQLLVSFYGMVITYFTYGDVLEHLLGVDPLGGEAIDRRKEHLHRMADLVLAAIGSE